MVSDPRLAAWLDDFAACIRDRNIAEARQLFAPDVLSYGTRTAVMTRLDDLAADQWSFVWPATTAFRFLRVDRIFGFAPTWTIATQWKSFSASGRARSGRATIVLSDLEGRILCEHSHFSLNPRDGGDLE